MKVLRLNDLSNWHYILTCRGCHSELTVNAEDLKRKDHLRHLSPWVTVVYDELYAVCPNCSYATTVPDTVIPDAIWDSVVAKAKAAEPPSKKEEKKWYHHPLAYVLFGLLAAVIMVFLFY